MEALAQEEIPNRFLHFTSDIRGRKGRALPLGYLLLSSDYSLVKPVLKDSPQPLLTAVYLLGLELAIWYLYISNWWTQTFQTSASVFHKGTQPAGPPRELMRTTSSAHGLLGNGSTAFSPPWQHGAVIALLWPFWIVVSHCFPVLLTVSPNTALRPGSRVPVHTLEQRGPSLMKRKHQESKRLIHTSVTWPEPAPDCDLLERTSSYISASAIWQP